MKQEFILQRNAPGVIIFFAGWGMDIHPFRHLESRCDIYICYDYTTLDALHVQALSGYRDIQVYAWSLGVWAAGRVLSPDITPDIDDIDVKFSCALGGTTFPIDDTYGIPEAIYGGTLRGLNAQTLQKFQQRMCGRKVDWEAFMQCAPQRSLENLREELAALREHYHNHPETTFEWEHAIILSKDRIFPVENQRHAWDRLQVEYREYPFPHYDAALFEYLFQ